MFIFKEKRYDDTEKLYDAMTPEERQMIVADWLLACYESGYSNPFKDMAACYESGSLPSGKDVFDDAVSDWVREEHEDLMKDGEHVAEWFGIEYRLDPCCICGGMLDDIYGNNPYPVKEHGRCCNRCNGLYVIPARIANLKSKPLSN